MPSLLNDLPLLPLPLELMPSEKALVDELLSALTAGPLDRPTSPSLGLPRELRLSPNLVTSDPGMVDPIDDILSTSSPEHQRTPDSPRPERPRKGVARGKHDPKGTLIKPGTNSVCKRNTRRRR